VEGLGDDSPIRAFFAVELDAAASRTAAVLVQTLRERSHGDRVRWVRPEALHVTLRFLGDIAPGQVAPLARAAGAEVATLAPFELTLGAVQLFPSSRRPRVVALEVGPEQPLRELAAAVERATVAEGFAPEPRRFRSHLTLGRVRASGQPPATRGLAAPTDSVCSVEQIVLFRSELTPSGSRYTPLERLALGGSPPPRRRHP